jgi:hypothetical protein
MKNSILAILVFISVTLSAQTHGGFVALKTGLNIRDKASTSGKVIDKIPYGTRVSFLETPEEPEMIRTEGMTGYWRKVTYNNKTGYIIDSYLFPVAPPKATVKKLKDYLVQLAPPFGAKLVVTSGKMNNVEEGGWELQKQLYKNGGEWHHFAGYEYGSDTYYLPDFTMQQAFQLIRMIPEFEKVWDVKDEFPTTSKTIKKGEIDYMVTVETEGMTEEPWIKRISIEYADGAVYSFELFMLDNQVVIFFGSGV